MSRTFFLRWSAGVAMFILGAGVARAFGGRSCGFIAALMIILAAVFEVTGGRAVMERRKNRNGRYLCVVIGNKWVGFSTYNDRIGRHISLWLSPASIGLVFHQSMWAGTFYIFKRRLWLRPIDYAAVETHERMQRGS